MYLLCHSAIIYIWNNIVWERNHSTQTILKTWINRIIVYIKWKLQFIWRKISKTKNKTILCWIELADWIYIWTDGRVKVFLHVHENYLTMLTLSLTDQNSCIFLLYESIRNAHPYIVEISMNENLERTLLLYHLFKCKFSQPTQFNIKLSCFLFCLF
jgi:hypothetical protein